MSLLINPYAFGTTGGGGGGGSVTLVGTGSDTDWAGTNPNNVTLPGGAASGNVAILCLATTNTNAPATTGGWTSVQNFDHNTNEYATMLVKELDGTDISNGYVQYTVTDVTGSSTIAALLFVFDGITTTVTASGTANGSYALSGVATSSGGIVVPMLVQCGSGGGYTPAFDSSGNTLSDKTTVGDTVFPDLSEVVAGWEDTDGSTSPSYDGTGGVNATTRAGIIASFGAA